MTRNQIRQRRLLLARVLCLVALTAALCTLVVMSR